MARAMTRASSRLRNRKILLVVDNARPGKYRNEDVDWLDFLSSLVGSKECLLFSTRSDLIGNTPRVHKVGFHTIKDICAAVSIFDQHLGIGEGKDRYNVNMRHKIVQKSGLPLALSTAALLVYRSNHKKRCRSIGA